MTNVAPKPREVDARLERFRSDEGAIRRAVTSLLVGQEAALGELLAVLLSGGHALVEGVPGTGKTMLVRAIAQAATLHFRRVQFTPDLLPADILGCDTLIPGDGHEPRIEFREGPIFTQFLLADEINRGTPRTQSALLEAMQERGVTVGTRTLALDPLFTVFATRNPIEMEGTYPLPEAQLDRFQMQVDLEGASLDEMVTIAERTTEREPQALDGVTTALRLLEMRAEVRNVIAAEPLLRFAARLIRATQPEDESAPRSVREAVRYGAGVRAVQSLILAAKVEALRQGRFHIARGDLERYLLPVIRHRLLFNLEGEARGVSARDIAAEILESVRP